MYIYLYRCSCAEDMWNVVFDVIIIFNTLPIIMPQYVASLILFSIHFHILFIYIYLLTILHSIIVYHHINLHIEVDVLYIHVEVIDEKKLYYGKIYFNAPAVIYFPELHAFSGKIKSGVRNWFNKKWIFFFKLRAKILKFFILFNFFIFVFSNFYEIF